MKSYNYKAGKFLLKTNQDGAIDLIAQSSDGGYPVAMLHMFTLQYDGVIPGGKRDARKWVDRAVSSGDSDALFYVGRACYRGQRMPKDYGKALSLFTQSTNQLARYGNIIISTEIKQAVKDWKNIIHYFESHNVPLNMRIDADGNTFMHVAAKRNDSHVVAYLMGRGVRPALNKQGELPKPRMFLGGKIRRINPAKRVGTELLLWERSKATKLPQGIWQMIAEFHGSGFPQRVR